MIIWTLTLILLAIAALHLLWAIGFWWPIRDEAGLARAVVGQRGITRMPGALPASLVVVALMTAAWWPWYGMVAGPRLYLVGLAFLALGFALRGVAAYLPAWRRLVPEQPFARLDRAAYGPLCLLIAGLYVLVFLKGLS